MGQSNFRSNQSCAHQLFDFCIQSEGFRKVVGGTCPLQQTIQQLRSRFQHFEDRDAIIVFPPGNQALRNHEAQHASDALARTGLAAPFLLNAASYLAVIAGLLAMRLPPFKVEQNTEPALRRFLSRLLFVEQPLHRDVALNEEVKKEFVAWKGRERCVTQGIVRFGFDQRKSAALRRNPKRGIGFDHHTHRRDVAESRGRALIVVMQNAAAIIFPTPAQEGRAFVRRALVSQAPARLKIFFQSKQFANAGVCEAERD